MVEISFHPKPQSLIVLKPEMFDDLGQDEHRYPSPRVKLYAKHHPGGWSTDLKLMQKLSGKTYSAASLKWCEWGKCPGTFIKQEIVDSGTMHPNRQRYLSMNEIKVIGSFPIDFEMINRKNCVERVGNSVPPNLMYAIAAHIKQWPFISTSEPTVISTFAGCGGSSLGYKLAGFKELLAVEWDDMAAKTFKLNFKNVPVYHGDIKELKSDHCMSLAGVKRGQLDVFDGSPPCQGFSSAGNRRLNDERNRLFLEYARLLNDLQPKVFVMENVKGMVSGHMKQVYLQCIKTLRECGYVAKGQIMNAKYYNVPQSRERVIIIGIRNDLYNVL